MNTNSVDFFNLNKVLPIKQNQKIIIAVWGIGNPGNMGQIIRLGHNLGAQQVIFVNDEIKFRESKIKKTAGFSYEQMEWQFISIPNFLDLLNSDYKLVVLETCEKAINIFHTSLPDKIILLAGSESHGLPSNIISKSNLSVYIPMPGACKSMNVSHAISVAAFEWYRQKSGKF